jgi:formate-dependent nitrite reductase membrane component NrfD
MNLFVADPGWGWWIVFYFFLGGIAAGAYFVATLIDLIGSKNDRELARLGYRIAFPLILVCGILLIVDLHRPGRFWHMLLRSEYVQASLDAGWPWSGRSWELMLQAPLLKTWSPMSIGSWAISLFGLCSFLSFIGSLWPEGRLARLLRFSWFGRGLQMLGCLVGFFVAAYTGVLLTATNQPLWSDSVWIGALFLTSAASTGIAMLILIARWKHSANEEAVERLERADVWALGLELFTFAVFLASLGAFLIPVLHTAHGWILVVGTLLLGVLVPMAIHLRLGTASQRWITAAAILALLGGFTLRYGLVMTPPEILSRGVAAMKASPEDARPRGGGPGAGPGNRLDEVQP